jgi:hypothetical protein
MLIAMAFPVDSHRGLYGLGQGSLQGVSVQEQCPPDGPGVSKTNVVHFDIDPCNSTSTPVLLEPVELSVRLRTTNSPCRGE